MKMPTAASGFHQRSRGGVARQHRPVAVQADQCALRAAGRIAQDRIGRGALQRRIERGPDLDRGAAAQVHFQAVLAGAAIDQAPVRPSVRQLHALPGRLRIGPELSHLQLQSL